MRNTNKKTSSDDTELARQNLLSVVGMPQSIMGSAAKYLSLTYKVRIKGKGASVLAIVDTGAQCSALRADVFEQLRDKANLRLRNVIRAIKADVRGVGGEPLKVIGTTVVPIYSQGIHSSVQVWVVEGMCPQLILGIPWIRKERPQVD